MITVLANPSDILSVEVFDTLLFRTNAGAAAARWEIARRYVDAAGESATFTFTAESAFYARVTAEKTCRQLSLWSYGSPVASLDSICAHASRLLVGDESLATAFAETECLYEQENVTLNSVFADYIGRHREGGGRLLLMTHLPYSKNQTEQILSACGFDQGQADAIVCVTDRAAGDQHQSVFDAAEAKMQAGPERFVHIGPDLALDFKAPIEHGWRALHLPISDADLEERKRDHRRALQLLTTEEGFATETLAALLPDA